MFVSTGATFRQFRPILHEGKLVHSCKTRFEVPSMISTHKKIHLVPMMQLPSSPSLDLFAETERLGMIRAFGNEMIFAALVLCFSIFVKRIYTSIELAARFKDPNLNAPLQSFSDFWNVFAGLVLFWTPLFVFFKAIWALSSQQSISCILIFGPYLISFATQGFIRSRLAKSFQFPVSSQSLLSLSTIIVSIPFQVWRLHHLHFSCVSLFKSVATESQMIMFISFMKAVTVVHMALYLLRLPWISSKANPFVSGNELYKKYESLQEEVKGLREQNKLLKELYGIKDIQNGGVQRVQRLAELESAYITKRTKVVTDDKKGGSDVDQGN
uniref:Uncharacterized protein n=1 Tax=Hanusia phi TaxID=3032 RepID=A0A7S0HVJ5_9CRYP|mmetsp:Transcript_36801/g.82955  ORF Transcript_36801/g.82955 Transcript_36801/m.82955 type:complete len:327 (+) Transcript_36801:174-1154(+)